MDLIVFAVPFFILLIVAELAYGVSTGRNTYRLNASKLVGVDMFLDEASVTATENLLMAAAAAEGTTIMRNAASEPHVQGIARMLTRMGAKIEGIGSNCMTITGSP